MRNPFKRKTDTTYYNQENTYTADKAIAKSESWVHKSAILRNKWVSENNAIHREMVAKYNEIAHSNIYKVAVALTKEAPLFVVPGTEDDEEPEIHEAAADFWSEYEYQKMLTNFIIACRNHGFGIFHPLKQQPRTLWDVQPAWRVYSAREISQIYTDPIGNPTSIKLDYTVLDQPLDPTIHWKDFIFFLPEYTLDLKGIPSNHVIWDSIMAYEGVFDSMQAFDQRLGNGFLTVVLGEQLGEAVKSGVEDKMKKTRTEKGLLITDTGDAPINVDWMNPGQGSRFVEDLTKIEEKAAWGIGLPLMWLKGNRSGAVTGSEEDRNSVYEMLRGFFKPYELFMKYVLLYHGIIANLDEIVIKPNISVDVSDLDMAQVENMKTNTIASKTWLTTNEKRELDGYDEMDEGQMSEEQEIMGMIQAVGDMGNEPGEEKDPNKEKKKEKPKADSSNDGVGAYFRDTSIMKLTSDLPISKQTVEKLRKHFDEEKRFRNKAFDVVLKTDSMSITENMVSFDGVLLAPHDSLNYPDHIEIQTPEEVRKWYDSNSPKEMYLGVEYAPNHNNSNEVMKVESVGTVKATGIDDDSNILANYKFDLTEVDKLLGKDNWIREYIKDKKNLPTSIGLFSRDKIRNGLTYRTDLDIRSAVLVKNPRNPKTKVIV